MPRFLQIASGPLIVGVSLGLATSMSNLLIEKGHGQSLLQAVLCCGLAVALLYITRHRGSESFGSTPYRLEIGRFVAGACVALICAVIALFVFQRMGLSKTVLMSPSTLLAFLASNAVIALLLEAIPEELTLRGRTFTALRRGNNLVVTCVLTTVLFMLVPLIANITLSVIDAIRTGGWSAPAFVPAGEDPIAYLVLLTVFGLTLATLRALSGSIWPGVGLHIAFLMFNRAVLFGSVERTGIATEFHSPDALLQVPVYLLLAAVAYGWLSLRKRRASRAA